MHKLYYEEEKTVVKQRGPGNKTKQIRLCDRKAEKKKSQWAGKDLTFKYIQLLLLKFHPEVA